MFTNILDITNIYHAIPVGLLFLFGFVLLYGSFMVIVEEKSERE